MAEIEALRTSYQEKLDKRQEQLTEFGNQMGVNATEIAEQQQDIEQGNDLADSLGEEIDFEEYYDD